MYFSWNILLIKRSFFIFVANFKLYSYEKILLIALSVIAFAACTKKDNDNDAKYTRAQLEGQWNYVESRMSDGKLFSQIVPAEAFNCIKKMNYIFKGDRWILNEYNYKNDEKTCKYNSASFLYVIKGSTICFVINDKALKALDVINLNESELVFKYNDEFKRIMRLQMQEQNSLELSGYTIDDILNVTITYRK